jgi:hypothetical protein
MSRQRYLDTKFWDDKYIVEKDPIEKLLFIYLLTNPLTNILGIYEISLSRIAFDTGLEKEMVLKILERFEKDNKVKYYEGYIALKNFTKYQANNPKINAGIKSLLKIVPVKLIEWINIDFKRLDIKDYRLYIGLDRTPKDSNLDSLSLKKDKKAKSLDNLSLKKDEKAKRLDIKDYRLYTGLDRTPKDSNYINTNININRKLDSLSLKKDEKANSNKEEEKEDKKLFLDSIYLTINEYEKLINEYGKEIIEKEMEDLQRYIAKTGKKYNSHYLTIKAWIRKEKRESEFKNEEIDNELPESNTIDLRKELGI